MALLRFPRLLPRLHPKEGVEWLILLVCACLFGGSFFYARYLEYLLVEEREQDRLQRQLVLVESNLVPQLHLARRALGTIATSFGAWVQEDGGARLAGQRVRLIAETLAGVHAILVVNAQGNVAAASSAQLVGTAMPYPQAMAALRKSFAPESLYVTPPFRMGQAWVIGLYRTITDADGGFGGIVLACVESRFFEVLLDSVRYAPDAWTYLAHGDGTLFLMQPQRPEVRGMALDDPRSFFSRHMRTGQPMSVFTGVALVTGEKRMIALRTIHPVDLRMDKSLVITVSRDTDAVFAPWKDSTRVQAGIFAVLVFICGAGLGMYQRRQRKADALAQRQQEFLQASEALQHAIFDASPDALLVVDTRDIITMTNKQVESVLGYRGSELVGQPIDILIPQRFRAMHATRKDAFSDSRLSLRMGHGVDVNALRRDGSECIVEIRISRVETPQGWFFVCSLRDQSERKSAQEQLRIAAVAFESQEALVVTDRLCRILRVNQAFTRITGFAADEVMGRNPSLLKSGRQGPEFYREMWATIEETGSWQGELWGRRKNGELYPKWLAISAVRGEDGQVTHYIGAHYDITAHKMAEAKIKELAFYDQLTGLPNRTLLADRLRQTMSSCLRDGTWGALLVIDLDNFKTLNDTLGHERGDALLKQAAIRLASYVGEGDTVARVGGDEFVVVLAGRHRKMVDAASATESTARKMLAALDAPYEMDGAVHHNTASVGVTLLGGESVSSEERMKQAELAMYRSKEEGRNGLRFFDPSMERAIHVRVALEKDLREALESCKFQLYYQAQACDDGTVLGAEVLLRWLHPQRGWVSPASFIPLAEETGLILPLGQWVLETVCAQLAAWGDDPLFADLTVAVNVSALQFQQNDFVDRVLGALRSHAANPQRIKIELTESLFVDKVEEIVQKMYQLKGHGIGFSLDDFGTGYSSLSYLKRLPLDQLKIDQSFVRDLLIDPNDAAIARTIVALAQSLGLGVIAEGVETQAQLDTLSHSGCHMYQGYLLSRPVPLGEFEEFVRSRGQAG
ncbi:bifunctional diguanylate cyclase/phosphodiesterase [Candidatus Symbiobacter mobilis]|uniref:Signal transduction protein n=1 Tax=Candidatus Symbiobacter mobilis CR TaxID=946483 RepID=U5NBI6_9BURK|nr:EAL domain-containing protein [Candidatus Symbiobacter mobilis]AGX87603.1 signal transduction protein [Candidatus Symbiobacter mobilis CR]